MSYARLNRQHLVLPMAVGILALAGCASTPPPAAPTPTAAASTATSAVVHLASASGSLVSGTLQLVPMGDGVHVTGEVGGLTGNSTHGIHIHETGDCSAADASSAGAHFNPDATAHGKNGTGVHHAGDMDNIAANNEGVAQVDLHVQGVSLGGPASSDIGGRAVVVHAAPDDYRTQPSGNSGARVACGVITLVR
jgi:Cu-Zn family superoxide dismutase